MWTDLPSAAESVGSVLGIFLAGALGVIVVIFVVRWLLASLSGK